MIRNWWQARSASEQRMLAGGGTLVAVLLVWAFAWHPLAAARVRNAEGLEARRAGLAFVQAGVAELAGLQAAGFEAGGLREGRSLLALADVTAREAGLAGWLRRVEPAGSGSVRVSFEGVAFDPLVSWLEDLVRRYGITVHELAVDRAEGLGRVDARLTLQDPPEGAL